MRWRGVSHVEFAVLDYDDSIAFYDALFGWLGYSSFLSLNMEYQSIYYMTRYVNPHSYIGIQPARTGEKLTHSDRRSASITLRCGRAAETKSTASFANSCSAGMSSSLTHQGSTRSTGPAIARCSSTTRSTGFIGSWRGCRKFAPPASFGRSIARFVVSRRVGRISRTGCLA
jgi:hypothetical protein